MNNVMNIIAKPFSPDAILAVVSHTLEKVGERSARSVEKGNIDSRIDIASLLPGNAAEQTPSDEIPAFDAALAGDLAVISIADVLLLLQDRGYTGTVRLSHGRAQLHIYLRDGRIDFAGAHGISDEFLLGRFLVSGGHLAEADLARVLAERLAKSDKDLLGAYLCSRGLLTSAGLHKAMAKQTSALVFEGLRWGSGRFSFRPDVTLPPVAREASLALSIDGLIVEGLRRVEEWRVIEQEIGDFDMTFVRNEDKLATFGRGKLLREEALIVDYLNGKNTVRDIIQISRMGSFDVTQVLFRLLRSKLIRRRVAPVVV
jgi:hypothetical protein